MKNNEKTQIIIEKIERANKNLVIKSKIRKGNPISQKEYNTILEEFIKKENDMYGTGVDTD